MSCLCGEAGFISPHHCSITLTKLSSNDTSFSPYFVNLLDYEGGGGVASKSIPKGNKKWRKPQKHSTFFKYWTKQSIFAVDYPEITDNWQQTTFSWCSYRKVSTNITLKPCFILPSLSKHADTQMHTARRVSQSLLATDKPQRNQQKGFCVPICSVDLNQPSRICPKPNGSSKGFWLYNGCYGLQSWQPETGNYYKQFVNPTATTRFLTCSRF